MKIKGILIKSISFMSIFLISITGMVMNGVPVSAAPTTVSLSPANQAVTGGGSFSVDMVIHTDVACRGWQTDIDFDATKLQAVSVVEGNFLSGYAGTHGGLTVPGFTPVIDNVNGHIQSISFAIMGAGDSGPTGTGVLGTLHFNTVAGINAATAITPASTLAFDAAGTAIPGVTTAAGAVTIGNFPMVTGITPAAGPAAGGTPVTITGANFVNGATVAIGGFAATGVTFINSATLAAVTPANTPGIKNIVVTNPDARAGTLTGGFNCQTDETTIDFMVNLQGGSRPESGWVVPLNVRLFTPGADLLTATPVYAFNLTTARTNGFATAPCAGVLTGSYDITVSSEHVLLNVKRNVVVVPSYNAINLGTLLEGNANNNDRINIQDFGLLATSYGRVSGDPVYNVMADFDRNGQINIFDFGLLATNYLKIAPVAAP